MLFRSGYRTGLQVWDLTNVGAVSEVLNLRGARWGTIESVTVLPTPISRGASGQDAFKAERPLLGLMYVVFYLVCVWRVY